MFSTLNQFLQKHLGLALVAAILVALYSPYYHDNLFLLLEPILMLMLFIVFIKTDVLEIIVHFKQPLFLLSVCMINLIIIPLGMFFLFSFLEPELLLGVLLICSLPSGTASPSLTDLLNGNTALALSIAILSSLLAPLTVPFVFSLVSDASLVVDAIGMFSTLARVVLIPMLLSQFIKKYLVKNPNKYSDILGVVSILSICSILFIALGKHRNSVLENPRIILYQLLLLYIIFIFLHFFGYFCGTGKSKRDKIALATSKAYMNNGIGIVLASSFLPPSVVIFMVLSEIPWATCVAPFRRILKHL